MKSFCIQLSFSDFIFMLPRLGFLNLWKKQPENHVGQLLVNLHLPFLEPEPLAGEERVDELDLIILVAYNGSIGELPRVIVLINHIVNNFLNGRKGLDNLFMAKMQHLFYTLFHGLDILFEQNSAVQLIAILTFLPPYLVILDIMDFYQGFMTQKISFLQVLGHGFILHCESLKDHLVAPIGYDQPILGLFDYPQGLAHFGVSPWPDVLAYIFSYHLILLLRVEHRFVQVSVFFFQK